MRVSGAKFVPAIAKARFPFASVVDETEVIEGGIFATTVNPEGSTYKSSLVEKSKCFGPGPGPRPNLRFTATELKPATPNRGSRTRARAPNGLTAKLTRAHSAIARQPAPNA